MANERNIGRIVTVDSLSVYVRLDDELKSLYKSGYEEIYPVARINSYIIIPVGAERIVAMVNRVMTREETDLTKSSGALFLTEASRYLSAWRKRSIPTHSGWLYPLTFDAGKGLKEA